MRATAILALTLLSILVFVATQTTENEAVAVPVPKPNATAANDAAKVSTPPVAPKKSETPVVATPVKKPEAPKAAAPAAKASVKESPKAATKTAIPAKETVKKATAKASAPAKETVKATKLDVISFSASVTSATIPAGTCKAIQIDLVSAVGIVKVFYKLAALYPRLAKALGRPEEALSHTGFSFKSSSPFSAHFSSSRVSDVKPTTFNSAAAYHYPSATGTDSGELAFEYSFLWPWSRVYLITCAGPKATVISEFKSRSVTDSAAEIFWAPLSVCTSVAAFLFLALLSVYGYNLRLGEWKDFDASAPSAHTDAAPASVKKESPVSLFRVDTISSLRENNKDFKSPPPVVKSKAERSPTPRRSKSNNTGSESPTTRSRSNLSTTESKSPTYETQHSPSGRPRRSTSITADAVPSSLRKRKTVDTESPAKKRA